MTQAARWTAAPWTLVALLTSVAGRFRRLFCPIRRLVLGPGDGICRLGLVEMQPWRRGAATGRGLELHPMALPGARTGNYAVPGRWPQDLEATSVTTNTHRCWRQRRQVLESRSDRRSGSLETTATSAGRSGEGLFCWKQPQFLLQPSSFFAGINHFFATMFLFCWNQGVSILLLPCFVFAGTILIFCYHVFDWQKQCSNFCYNHVSFVAGINQKSLLPCVFVWWNKCTNCFVTTVLSSATIGVVNCYISSSMTRRDP